MITKIILFLLIILILISCFIVVQICGLVKNSTKKNTHKKNKHTKHDKHNKHNKHNKYRHNKYRHNKYYGGNTINNDDLGLPSNAVLDDFSTWYTSHYDKNLNIFYNRTSNICEPYFARLKNIIIDNNYYYNTFYINKYELYTPYELTINSSEPHINILNNNIPGYTNYSFFKDCSLDELIHVLIFKYDMFAHINNSKTSKDINGLVTNLLAQYNLSGITINTNKIIQYIKQIIRIRPKSDGFYKSDYNNFNIYYFANLDTFSSLTDINKPLINNILKNIIIQLYAYYNTKNNIIYNNYLDSNSPYFIYMYIIYNNIHKYMQSINNIKNNIISVIYKSPNIFLKWIINTISNYITNIELYENNLIACISSIKNYKQAYIPIKNDSDMIPNKINQIIYEFCEDKNNILLKNNIIPPNYYNIDIFDKFNNLFKNSFIKMKKTGTKDTIIYKTIYKNVFENTNKLTIIDNLYEIIKKTKEFYNQNLKKITSDLLILQISDTTYTFGFLFKIMILDTKLINNNQLQNIITNTQFIDYISSIQKNANADGTMQDSYQTYNSIERSYIYKRELSNLLKKMINKNYNEIDYTLPKRPEMITTTDPITGRITSTRRASLIVPVVSNQQLVKNALDINSISYDVFIRVISEKNSDGTYNILYPLSAIKIINKIAKEKDKIAEEKDKMLREKDEILEEKDKILEEKDKILEEKDKIIGNIGSNTQSDIIEPTPIIIEQSTIITTESNTNYLNKLHFMPIQNKCKLVIR